MNKDPTQIEIIVLIVQQHNHVINCKIRFDLLE